MSLPPTDMRRPHSLSLTGSHAVLHGTPDCRVRVRDRDWREALRELFAFHREQYENRKLRVRLQLGQDHARIAIMTVDEPAGLGSVPSAQHAALVNTWAADMLHLDPTEQIVRWKPLADARQVLVSCVDRLLTEELEGVCAQAGVHLASCRPAVLCAVQAAEQLFARGAARDLTLIWTEDGEALGRHGVVQLLRFQNRRLAGTWRGWLSPEDGQDDAALEAVLSHFEPRGTAADAVRARIHWPPASGTTE